MGQQDELQAIAETGKETLRQGGFFNRLYGLAKRPTDRKAWNGFNARDGILTDGDWLSLWPLAESGESAQDCLIGADWDAVASRWAIEGWEPVPALHGYTDYASVKCTRRPLTTTEALEWAAKPCWTIEEAALLLYGLSPTKAITSLDIALAARTRADGFSFPEPRLPRSDDFTRACAANVIQPLTPGHYSPASVIDWGVQNHIGCAVNWARLGMAGAVLFNEALSGRDFGGKCVIVSELVAWANTKAGTLNASELETVKRYEIAQIEAALSYVEKEAQRVATMHLADDKTGATSQSWEHGAVRHKAWRELLTAGEKNGEIRIFDNPLLARIGLNQVTECHGESRNVTPTAASAALELPMKKKALLDKYRRTYPRLEAWLKDASNNGLSEHAKAGKREWYESRVIEWCNKQTHVEAGGAIGDTGNNPLNAFVTRSWGNRMK